MLAGPHRWATLLIDKNITSILSWSKLKIFKGHTLSSVYLKKFKTFTITNKMMMKTMKRKLHRGKGKTMMIKPQT